MTKFPKITIITPSLNQGQFIERTIMSVLDQHYPNLEYIVMDGGSKDETLDILARFEGRLRWISAPDRGQADAINKGLRLASGDIVAFLNSDDVYEPGTFERVARYFVDHPDAMWLTGKCRIIDEQDREVRKCITVYKNLLLKWYSYSLLLVTNPISQPATFWRRRLADEIGLFNPEEHLVMDYDYWLRIGEKYPLAVLPTYSARFRVYLTSKTSTFFLTTFRRELELAKSHSTSPLLNILHHLSYLAIASVYQIMNMRADRHRGRP
ncbi:MAG: glycosyltransferase [Nitrospirota bacterium]|nr:glycosyltransferase [Nitrospirota bacterium]